MMYDILKCLLCEKFLTTSRGRYDDESVGGDDNPLNPSLPAESPVSSLKIAENG